MKVETMLRGAMARGYCTEENKYKVLDPDLIEAMAQEVLKSLKESFWIKKKRGVK